MQLSWTQSSIPSLTAVQCAEHDADYVDIDEQQPDVPRGCEERLPGAHDEDDEEYQHEAVIREFVEEETAWNKFRERNQLDIFDMASPSRGSEGRQCAIVLSH